MIMWICELVALWWSICLAVWWAQALARACWWDFKDRKPLVNVCPIYFPVSQTQVEPPIRCGISLCSSKLQPKLQASHNPNLLWETSPHSGLIVEIVLIYLANEVNARRLSLRVILGGGKITLHNLFADKVIALYLLVYWTKQKLQT